jgi:hypothetical protein
LGNVCVGQVTACHLKGVPPYQACVLAPKHWAYGDTPLEAARAAVRLACDMWAGVEEDPGDDLAVAA